MTGNNALVEGKNARVARRHLGHEHVPARFADDADAFARGHLSPFVNFHRPSLYATEYVDSKGKVRRKYLRDDVKTPYEKRKSLSGAAGHPKPGLTFGRSTGSPARSRTWNPLGRSTRPAPNCSGGFARPPRRREGQGTVPPAFPTACPPPLSCSREPRPWTGRGKRYISRGSQEEAPLYAAASKHVAASKPPRRIEPQPPPRQTRP